MLAYIPQGRPYDFGRELFPLLLKRNLPVYAYPMQGYWCDVGDVSAYVNACADLLDGAARLECAVEADAAGNQIAPEAHVSEHAQIVAPCYIGPGVQIAPGAVVGPHASVEAYAHIARGAKVKRSVVHASARIAANASVSGAVVAANAQVRGRSSLLEGCVLGEGAILEEEASLGPGAVSYTHLVSQRTLWMHRGDCRLWLCDGDILL